MSRECMEVIDDKNQPLYTRLPLAPQPAPWYIILHGKNKQRQTFFNILENRYYTRIIPSMRNKRIFFCHDGWLILIDFSLVDCFLLNALSMEKMQLPPLVKFNYNICLLSSSPSDSDCRVLFINGVHRSFISCHLGDDEFVTKDLVLEDDFLVNATIFEGKIYGLTMPKYNLVTADFKDPNLEFVGVIMEESTMQVLPINASSGSWLVESCGELLFIHKRFMGSDVKDVLDFIVFRVDFSRKAWERVKHIGQRAIFISGNECISCSTAGVEIRGNSIYYHGETARNLYVFNLETERISMSLPCPIVSSRWSEPTWVMIP